SLPFKRRKFDPHPPLRGSLSQWESLQDCPSASGRRWSEGPDEGLRTLANIDDRLSFDTESSAFRGEVQINEKTLSVRAVSGGGSGRPGFCADFSSEFHGCLSRRRAHQRARCGGT